MKLIYILIISFFILSCESNDLTFYENVAPIDIISYIDNTIVVHLAERFNVTCNVPTLTYRVLYPNGTSNLINITDHPIPLYNFCDDPYGPPEDLVYGNIYFQKTIVNYVFVIYGINVNDTAETKYGLMIDWNGNITSNTMLGSFELNDSSGYAFYKDDDDLYNYLVFEKIENSNNRNLKSFITQPDTGGLNKQPNDELIQLQNYNKLFIQTTVDSNILFIFVNNYTTRDPLEPTWKIYGSILQKDSNQLSDPFLIYQTSTPQLDFDQVGCDKFFNGSGFYCDLKFYNIPKNNSDTPIPTTPIKVTFLSNGHVTETQLDNFNGFDPFKVFILKSGDAIALKLNRSDPNACDTNTSTLDLSFSKTVHSNISCFDTQFTFMRNNTALIVQDIKPNYWSLSTIDFPQSLKDNGYDNPIINKTIPAINGNIPVETTQLEIDFNVPVKCSSQNVSIYQLLDDGTTILRESYSGESNNCTVSSDNTVLLSVLPSSFNQPDSKYYVKVDSNFVKQNDTLEPLLGISKSNWIISTESKYYDIDDSTHAFVRLTPSATSYFKSLSSEQKSDFFRDLKNQLVQIVPIPDNRITVDNHFQIDPTALDQILISINIMKSNLTSKINVSTVVKTLNIMIQNKGTTLISRNNATAMLDESYGLQTYQTLLELLTIPAIVMGAILLVLGIIYLWACRKHKEGKNLVFIITAFMFYDFIMDLLFIFDLKTKNLMLLFWLSIAYTIPPIFLNISVAFYVITKENSTNRKFYQYFIKNSAIVSIISVISGADIEVLHILSSNFAGFGVFTAPFSDRAEKNLFWCSLIGFCIEDIPQFAIQMAYKSSRVEYTIIPVLALISSSLMLLNNIVGKLYFAIIKYKNINNRVSFQPSERDVNERGVIEVSETNT